MTHTVPANRLPFPAAQLIKSDGTPASGWTLTFYLTGSATLSSVYTDVDLTAATNALVLNSYGMPDVDIYLDPDIDYRLKITDDSAATIFTFDHVRDFTRHSVAHFQVYAGSPNGNLSGTAGVVDGSPADAIFDTTNNIVWVCTTTGTAATAVWTNVSAALSGAVVMSGVLSPASFTTQQDNYAPTDIATASTVRFNPGADSDVTGMSGGSSGRQMTLINISTSFRVTLRNQNTSSLVANRFLLPNSLDVALLPNYVCVVQYDALTGYWRLKSGPRTLDLGNGQYVSNASFAVSVASNAITIALKTALGSDPTAGDPVLVAFRNTTAGTGTYSIVAITAALSLVISAGSTLGFTTSEANLIHVGFINNSGTVELAASKDGGLWAEDRTVSTTAEGGSGGADTAAVLYSTTARSGVACRLAAIIAITTGATPGNWGTAPSRLSLVTGSLGFPYKNRILSWANVIAAGTTLTDAFNVSSITDVGTGALTVTYAVAMTAASYAALGNTFSGGSTAGNHVGLTTIAAASATFGALKTDGTANAADPATGGWRVMTVGF